MPKQRKAAANKGFCASGADGSTIGFLFFTVPHGRPRSVRA